ncbi:MULTISPECIES: hypothetical protein [unclassified Saccharicrinis]|uniref:hypothetical protein n=1 Tax=unclassified Saccharicrinis TaxID=2646859 RepID=UPI003D32F026
MDNQTNQETQVVPALAFSENALKFLKTGAGWAKFIAIIGFIFVGLIAFGGLIFGIVFSFIGDGMFPVPMPFPPAIFSFLYLILALIYFFPVFYLYKFSSKAYEAVVTLTSKNLEIAMLNLKSYFKFIGILIIVMFALYAIGIIVMIAGFSFFQNEIMQMGGGAVM